MANTTLDNQIVTFQQGNLYLIQSPSSSYTSSGALTCSGNSNAIFTNAPYSGQLNYQWLIQPVSSPSALNSSQTYYIINQSNSLGLQLCPTSEVCPGPPASSTTPQPNPVCVDASIVTAPPQTSLWTITTSSINSVALRNAYTGLYLSPCNQCLNGPSTVTSQPIVNQRTPNPTTLLIFTIVGSAPPPTSSISPMSLIPSLLPSPSPSPSPSSGLSPGIIAAIVIAVLVLLVLIIVLAIWAAKRKTGEPTELPDDS